MVAPRQDPLVGQLIGGCRIQSPLGRGGMGVVYRAVQERLRAPVALKVIKPEMGLNERAIARFEREAREIAKLRGETNHVVQIFDFGMDEQHGVYFISMELVDGEGVDSLVRRHGGLAEAQAIELAHQAALGLEVAREHGMVHRDIKPENLLLSKKGVLKITDFGLAKGLDDQSQQMTADGQALGTPAYMSPEQAEALELDHRSDIYSLGATLYSLVTGATPYKADSAVTMALQHITAPVPDAREAGYEVSAELNQVIKKAMAKSAAGRFQTAGEMAKSLKAILDARQPGGASPQQTLSLMVQPAADDTMLVIEEDTGRATPVAGDRESTGDTLAAADVTAMEFQGRPAPTGLQATFPDAPPSPTVVVAPRSLAPWVLLGLLVLLLAAGGVWWATRGEGGGRTDPPPVTKKMQLGTPDAPDEGALLADGTVRVKGRLQATVEGGWVKVNGTLADVRRDVYDATLTLPDGAHTLVLTAGTGSTEHDKLSVHVVVDATAPVVEWEAPAEDAVLAARTVPVRGRVVEANLRTCTLEGAPLVVTDGAFATTIELADGRRTLAITVEDRAGHRTAASRRVTVDTTPPRLTLRGAGPQTVEQAAFTLVGLVEDLTDVTVTVNGEAAEVRNGDLAHPVTLRPGTQTLTVLAVDRAGLTAEASVEVTYVALPAGVAPGATAGVYAWQRDGAPLVAMGTGPGRVFVDRDEVTVARYAAFLAAVGDAAAAHVPRDWARQSAAGNESRPVVGVSWASANAYAAWAGKALPTVAEWLAAAGGTERAWPWGDAVPRSALCVFDRDPALGRKGRGVDPVGSHPAGASPAGCLDLAGNAAEWTADAGATPGTRVVKGGSWTDPAEACRNDAARDVAEGARLYTVGFRCVVRDAK